MPSDWLGHGSVPLVGKAVKIAAARKWATGIEVWYAKD
jgi:hypothetical protein